VASVSVTPDQDTIIGEVFIAAPPERVFQALTDPQQLLQWWGQKGMFQSTRWSIDPRVGGKWRGEAEMRGSSFWMEGEYLEFDPPRLLVYTWVTSMPGETPSTVRLEMKAEGQGTRVKLQHSGLAANPAALVNYRGMWPSMLVWMREFVEKGETAETRPFVAPQS
jgi:uncharacterized protein YndB with AHSA1/START domain